MNANEEIDKKLRDALKKADEWKARFADAVERLEGKLHCADDCKCSGRLEVNMLRGFLSKNVPVMPRPPQPMKP